MLCRGPLCASVGLGRSVPGSGVLALLSLSERGRWSGGQGVAEEGAHLRERLPRRNRVPAHHGLSGSRRRARSPRPSGPRESERRGKGMITSRRARDGGPSGGRAAKTVSLPVRASRGDSWSCRSDLDCRRHGSFSDCGPGPPRRRRAHPDSGTASPPQGPHLSHLSGKPRLLHKGCSTRTGSAHSAVDVFGWGSCRDSACHAQSMGNVLRGPQADVEGTRPVPGRPEGILCTSWPCAPGSPLGEFQALSHSLPFPLLFLLVLSIHIERPSRSLFRTLPS